jgi:hypothetical protein
MSLTRAEIAGWAAKLDAARRDRMACEPISSTVVLDLDDAYAIQRAGTELRVARGENVVGWKLGYTSSAMRAQMGIEHPNFGPLTDAMLLAHDGAVGASLIQPRVEPEIGLRLAQPLTGEVTLDDVMGAVGEAFACLEIVDSVYPDYRFGWKTTPPMARRPRRSWLDQRFLASTLWSLSQWCFCTTARTPVRRRAQRHQAILQPASSGWSRSWPCKVGCSMPATSSSPAG